MKFSFIDFVRLFGLKAGQTGNNNVGEFVEFVLAKNGIPFTSSNGNIYDVSKVGKPLFSVHMDTVRSGKGEPSPIKIELSNKISSPNHVLGGDDLNGVFILLNLILEKEINFVFSMDEEVGGTVGEFVKEQRKAFRKNCPYFIVLDRKGNSDICVEASNTYYGSPAFEKAIYAFGENYGYFPSRAMMSDADTLSATCVSGCNISVGFYNAHTKNEYVLWNDVLKAYRFSVAIIDNFVFSEDIKPRIEARKKKLEERKAFFKAMQERYPELFYRGDGDFIATTHYPAVLTSNNEIVKVKIITEDKAEKEIPFKPEVVLGATPAASPEVLPALVEEKEIEAPLPPPVVVALPEKKLTVDEKINNYKGEVIEIQPSTFIPPIKSDEFVE